MIASHGFLRLEGEPHKRDRGRRIARLRQQPAQVIFEPGVTAERVTLGVGQGGDPYGEMLWIDLDRPNREGVRASVQRLHMGANGHLRAGGGLLHVVLPEQG